MRTLGKNWFRDFVKFVKGNFEIFQKHFDAEAATECIL